MISAKGSLSFFEGRTARRTGVESRGVFHPEDDPDTPPSNFLAAGLSSILFTVGWCYTLSRGSGGNDTLLFIALLRTTFVVSMLFQ